MLTLQEVISEEMKNPEFKVEWDALEPEFENIRIRIEGSEMNALAQEQFSVAGRSLEVGPK